MKQRARHVSLVLCILAGIALLASNSAAFAQVAASSSDLATTNYGLVVDNSGSMRSEFAEVVRLAASIASANRSTDEAFVLRFVSSEKIEILQRITRDKRALASAIESMYVEGGETALIDALYEAADYLSRAARCDQPNCLRSLVVVTDGANRKSRIKLNELVTVLKSAQIRVFVVGMTYRLKSDEGTGVFNKATELLTRIAAESGGRAFFAKSSSVVETIAKDVVNSIRN